MAARTVWNDELRHFQPMYIWRLRYYRNFT